MNSSYSTYAIDAIRQLGPDGLGYGASEEIVSGIRSAVKFRLPPNGELATNPVEVHSNLSAAYRLPFPKIVAEYETDILPSGKHGSLRATKVVTYAREIENLRNFAPRFGLGGAPDCGGYFMHSTIMTETGVWVPTFFAALVPYGGDHIEEKGGHSKIPMHCFGLGGKFEAKAKASGAFPTKMEMVNEYYVDATAVLNIALCSMCENVEHEVVKGPKHTNKTRTKKGKEPFYEYRVLKVRGEAARIYGEVGSKSSGVRLHMRRGHIRKLSSGRLTWVRHCVVGDKSRGIIMKEYDLQ